MTQAEALYKFFKSFGISAFPNVAPKDTQYPYLIYELKTGYFGDAVSCAINLYYHTESEKLPNAKVKEIGDTIGAGGIRIPYDGGTIWITRTTPWCISVTENEIALKHKQLLTMLEFC